MMDKFIDWLLRKKPYWLLIPAALLFLMLFGIGPLRILFAIGMCAFAAKAMIDEKKEKKNVKEQEQRHQEVKQQYIAMTDKILKLMQNYSPTYSEEDPRKVWAEFNRMIQMLGIEKKNAVYGIYGDVYCSLCNVFQEAYMRNFMVKMLHFYYNIAFSYKLDTTEQNALLYYLRWCFRNDQVWTKIGDGHPKFYNFIFPADDGIDYWNEQCVELLEEGCKVKSAFATGLLADCYYDNKLVPQRDYNKAFALYRQAAQLGNIHAVYMMGQCYENARGTKKNYQKAGDCYQYAYETSRDSSRKKRYADEVDRLYTAQKWDKKKYSPDIFSCNMVKMKKGNLKKLRAEVAECAQADLDTANLKLVATNVRLILEEVVNAFVESHANESLDDNLMEKINLLLNKGCFSKEIANKAHSIRKVGNSGAHVGLTVNVDELEQAIRDVDDIVEYYAEY